MNISSKGPNKLKLNKNFHQFLKNNRLYKNKIINNYVIILTWLLKRLLQKIGF